MSPGSDYNAKELADLSSAIGSCFIGPLVREITMRGVLSTHDVVRPCMFIVIAGSSGDA